MTCSFFSSSFVIVLGVALSSFKVEVPFIVATEHGRCERDTGERERRGRVREE